MTIPSQRLHPNDIHHQLDWLEQGWHEDELFVSRRLRRLRETLNQLPDPIHTQALHHHRRLCRARLTLDIDWQAELVTLRALIATIPKPERVTCPDCRLQLHPSKLADHQAVVHWKEHAA